MKYVLRYYLVSTEVFKLAVLYKYQFSYLSNIFTISFLLCEILLAKPHSYETESLLFQDTFISRAG